MPTVTITGGSVCGGGNHRIIETDRGTFHITSDQIQDMIPLDRLEARDNFIVIVRHLYWSRRDAGRTHNQALADIVNNTKVFL